MCTLTKKLVHICTSARLSMFVTVILSSNLQNFILSHATLLIGRCFTKYLGFVISFADYCPDDKFSCHMHKKCYAPTERCDGQAVCSNSQDEIGCCKCFYFILVHLTKFQCEIVWIGSKFLLFKLCSWNKKIFLGFGWEKNDPIFILDE